MTRREKVVSSSIVYAILHSDDNDKRSVLSRLLSFLWLYYLAFVRFRNDLFVNLRKEWGIEDEAYNASFAGDDWKDVRLRPMAAMGFSGSTFFTTENSMYLVKSVPRKFEHSFFRDDLLTDYVEHMHAHPDSLLVRITDFLQCRQSTIGTILGTAPTHHIVMNNILNGQSEDEGSKWETWDLKPTSYFFPERDIAGGALASEATKNKLADEFNERVTLNVEQRANSRKVLEADTSLLQEANAVDYSLFLVRIPSTPADSTDNPFSDHHEEDANASAEPAGVAPEQETWRTGVKSADGKYIYRAALLDFFWAKHKMQPMVMTGMIRSWNLIANQGPMSITTTSQEYRERFLKMCMEFVDVEEQDV